MGSCLCCSRGKRAGEKNTKDQPSPGTQRQQAADAADQRQKDNEGKGVQDPEALKRKQKMLEEAERKAEKGAQVDGLRWQVG